MSDKGTEFAVETLPNGLFVIKMKRGGKAPPMCDELFTARSIAEHRLSQYLRANDRAGYAVFPGKEDNAKG